MRDAKDVFIEMWQSATWRGWFTTAGTTIHPQGVEHGKTTIVARNNVPGLGLVLTVHEEGRHYWSGRGDQGYAPASLKTWLVAYNEDHERYQYVQLTDVEPPKNAQERASGSAAHISYLESQR